MRTISLSALILCLGGFAGTAVSQDAPLRDEQKKPLALFASFRELMSEGKFDIAANFLKLFLDSNPSDAELLELEKKHGTTVFESLRNVKWSDDKAVQQQVRANVEEIIKRARAASQKLLFNPARVAKYIRNLGATREERLFAELELKRTGDYAVPFMVEELRTTREPAIYDGLLETIGLLDDYTMAGWIAALDGLTEEKQFGVVTKIVGRDDILKLHANAQTDLAPFLWKILGQPANRNPEMRKMAERVLNSMTPGAKADTRHPDAELLAAARTFYDNTAKFANIRNTPEGSPQGVALWVWDAATSKVVKLENVPLDKAREFFGLRYARWVLNVKPTDAAAQGLMLSLAAEKAIERANYGNLATAEPAVYKLLSDAPSPVLAEQLSRGINQKKISLVLAMLQVLGDRGDRDVATPPAGPGDRPSLLIRALTEIHDPRVQFAAANALLRSPVPAPGAIKPRIVEVLRAAAATDPSLPETSKGMALLADPNRIRAASTASLLRGLGYDVDSVTTGRDLLRRIAHSSDFDVIVIDHHTANPELIDLIGQIQADLSAANRPILVVASSDKSRVPTFDQLIVRFAALIASTENLTVPLEAAYATRLRDRQTKDEVDSNKKSNAFGRDQGFRRAAQDRMERLNRLINSSGIKLTDTQRILMNLRVELVTYAILKLQYPYSEESAPETVLSVSKLRRQLEAQPLSPPYGAGIPTQELLKLMERFEMDLVKVPDRRKEFESLYGRIDPRDFGMTVETYREPAVEARLTRMLRYYPSVRIVSEPFSRTDMTNVLLASYQDSSQAPRDTSEKKATQKAAIEWLRKMATGEVPGYDIKSTEEVLRAALRFDDLAENAIAAVSRFGSAAVQEDLLVLTLNRMRPMALRQKAADATIRNIQLSGKSISKPLIPSLIEQSSTEPDLSLRGKILILKGMLAFEPGDFLSQLKGYSPPLVPPPPAKEPAKEPVKD